MKRQNPFLARLPDLITIIMVPLLWLIVDQRGAPEYFMRYNVLTQVALVIALITALMALFYAGFGMLSRWCAFAAGIAALNWFEASMRMHELVLPALYMVLQIGLPRIRIRLSNEPEDDREALPTTVTALSNFSHVFHNEPAKPLDKDDLWKRPLYTAERASRNWTLQLADTPWPRITLALIAFSVIVFLIGWLLLPSGLHSLNGLWHGLYPSLVPETLSGGLWHTLTSALLIWSFAQLVINALLLFWIGRVLEPTFSRQRFAVYALSGALVGLTTGVLRPTALHFGTVFTGVTAALLGVYVVTLLVHIRVLGLRDKQRGLVLIVVMVLVLNAIFGSGISDFATVNLHAVLVGLLAGGLLSALAGPHYSAVADSTTPNTLTIRTGSLFRRV